MSEPKQLQEHESVYWSPEMADILEKWGEKNAWHELDFLFAARTGRVLDIACGTGKNIADLSRFDGLDIHGCDISDLLIGKALERGVAAERLTVCNATDMPYAAGSFDFCYSIGSLEHFRDGAEVRMIEESARVVTTAAFHMIPLSRSGEDEGWITPYQGYYNNSADWWLLRFRASFRSVYILPSLWDDGQSVGAWFICHK